MTAQNRRHVHTCASNKANRFQKPSTTSSLYGSSDALNDDDKRHQSQKREREKSKCRIIDNISLLYMHSYSERATDYWWRRLQRNTPFTRDQAMENCVFFPLQAVIHSAPVHLSLDQLQKHSHKKKNNAQ